MRKGGGKQKGAAFEREVCKRMSLLVSRGERDDHFWRSAMSGGRASLADGKTRVAQAGDVSSITSEGARFLGRLFVECKFYRSLDLEGFLFEGKGKLAQFWNKAKQKAKAHGMTPMLIAKQNGRPTLVLVGYDRASYGPSLFGPFAVIRDARLHKFDTVFPPKEKYVKRRLLSKRSASGRLAKR